MKTFNEWMKNQVDEQQIDMIYDKCKIAIELVNQFDPDLLSRISTIANLASGGAYGLYASSDSSKQLPPDVQRWLVYRGVKEDQINKVPQVILKKWGVDERKIGIEDTIHVNVRRILAQSKNDLDAVLQVASTVCHEAVHVREHELTGVSSETGPMAVEQKFMNWAKQNIEQIQKKIGA